MPGAGLRVSAAGRRSGTGQNRRFQVSVWQYLETGERAVWDAANAGRIRLCDGSCAGHRGAHRNLQRSVSGALLSEKTLPAVEKRGGSDGRHSFGDLRLFRPDGYCSFHTQAFQFFRHERAGSGDCSGDDDFADDYFRLGNFDPQCG